MCPRHEILSCLRRCKWYDHHADWVNRGLRRRHIYSSSVYMRLMCAGGYSRGVVNDWDLRVNDLTTVHITHLTSPHSTSSNWPLRLNSERAVIGRTGSLRGAWPSSRPLSAPNSGEMRSASWGRMRWGEVRWMWTFLDDSIIRRDF